MRRVICLLLVVVLGSLAQLVSGATVFSNKAHNLRRQPPGKINGCVINLPSNLNFAPVITDQKTRETLIPSTTSSNKGSSSSASGFAGPLYLLNVESDRKIKVSCGRGNPLAEFEPYYYLLLECVRGTEFLNQHDEQIILQEGIECTKTVKASATVVRNGTCSNNRNATNFDIKFLAEFPPRHFYSVCVDEEISGTLFSSSYIDGGSFANGSAESSGNRPDFRGVEFYPFPIKEAYKWENAYEHLSDLLGSSDLVDEYFPTQQHHFSRGHLFPNADGVKRFEKHATFFYINTVPQWQLLNGGNWATVEQDVRDFSALLRRTFHVVTGSFGVTTLKDVNGNDVEVYLARDRTGKLRLPVPRFVWKVIHDPIAQSAVAIVQVNNPWLSQRREWQQQKQQQQKSNDILCTDVCDKLPWVRSANFHVERKGFTYCCDVRELQKAIPYLPRVEYNGLLGEGYVDKNNNNNGNEGNNKGSDSEDYDDDDDEDDVDEEEEEDDESGSSSSSSSSSDSDSNSDEASLPHRKQGQNNSPHDITKLFQSIKLF